MLLKTQGIIIKKSNLGEVDKLLTVYTENLGKILVKAKSVRKNQAKLKGHLELFSNSHLMIAPGRGFDIITGAETIEGFSFLHQDLSLLAATHYLSELIDKLIPVPEKDINIWQLILNSFQDLDQQNQSVKFIISNFENRLLEFLGYSPEQEDMVSFAESFSGEKFNSKYFLQSVNHLVK